MITETSDKTELATEIKEVVSLMKETMLSVDEKKVNTVPYQDSWTAGQLFRHVIKSTNGIARAMSIKSKPAERTAGERIPELKNTFLNFSSKMQSPDFIVPEERTYEKQAVISDLDNSFEKLIESAKAVDLTEQVDGLPLGAITKLELLHFVLYHTQRHLHQMKKIADALN